MPIASRLRHLLLPTNSSPSQPTWDSQPWRGELLKTSFETLSFGAVLGVLISVSTGAVSTWTVAILTALVPLLYVASRTPQKRPRLVSTIILIVSTAVVLLILLQVIWSPGVVTALCLLVVFANLLSGHWLALGLILTTATTLVCAGFAVMRGWTPHVVYEMYDPSDIGNWIRSGIEVVSFSLVSVRVFEKAIDGLTEAALEERRSLDETRREHALAEQTRTEQQKREIQLRNALKLQTVAQLGQGFSHLFNNVITIIRSALDEARAAMDLNQFSANIEAIADASSLGATKNRDLLTLSRPKRDEHESIRICEELLSCVRKTRGRLRDNIQTIVTCDADATIPLSRSAFEQLLTNLLLNAEQAMPHGGRVFLSTSQVCVDKTNSTPIDGLTFGNYLLLTVTDEGSGMSEETLQRACEPFYTTKDREEHEGLGLTAVAGMLKELRGGISFDSTVKGSSVRLFFPIPESFISIKHQKTEPSKPNASTFPQHSTSIVNWNTIETRSDRTESLPTPPPSWSAIGTINDWQDAATQRLLWGTFALFSLGTFVGVLQLKGYRLNVLTTGLVPLAALALAAIRRSWSVRVRGSILILSLFYTGSLLLKEATFMSPSAVAMLSLAILLAAELIGRKASLVTAGATFCLFLIGGVLNRNSGGVIGHNFLNPNFATSWWRIGLFLALVQFLFSWAALHVVHSSRRQLSRAHRALQRYEEVQRERQQLGDAAIATNAMLARISRMETAGRLIGTVAHDLNNSLQAIVTWTDLLKTDHSPEFCTEALDGIEQSTDYAEALIQQIQLGRTERGTSRSIDIGRALTEMQPMLESVLHRNHNEHLKLEMSIESQCFVKIQQATLRRMMLNLVANARDAIPNTGRCSIELSHQDANIVLSVTDSGIGMDATTLARVSEPFFTTKGDQGTGLGLHSIKELMGATNGRVEIQSRVGEGTSVFLYWQPSDPSETTTVTRITRDASHGKGRILLVEDEEGVLNTLYRALERGGYQVVTARDGDEAMRKLVEGDFDVLCTDAVMPGCPTDRVIEEYATRYPKRPILLMSGHLPAEFSQSALSNPAVSFLSKPFGGRALLNELDRRLAQRH